MAGDAHPLSALAGLADRRQKAIDASVLALPIERWDDPSPVVHFTPVDSETLRKNAKKIEKFDKAGDQEGIVLANADLLIQACKFITIGDKELAGFGDEELAAALKIEPVNARKACKALYLFDGDLLRVANQVTQWSGFRNEQADQEFAGE